MDSRWPGREVFRTVLTCGSESNGRFRVFLAGVIHVLSEAHEGRTARSPLAERSFVLLVTRLPASPARQVLLLHLLIFDRKMSEAPAGAAGPSSGHPAATDELPRPSDAVPVLSPDDLLRILSDPEYFGLATGVWYAINASDALVESHAEHTLAGRMGLSAETLKELADATGLVKRAATVTKMLNAIRTRPGHLALSPRAQVAWLGLEHFRYGLGAQ